MKLYFRALQRGLLTIQTVGNPKELRFGSLTETASLLHLVHHFLNGIDDVFIGDNANLQFDELHKNIFIGSLLISLTVAAIMLPRSGINIIDHNNQQQFIEFIPEAGYPLWVFSLLIGGLAIHFIANLRWHIISQRDH